MPSETQKEMIRYHIKRIIDVLVYACVTLAKNEQGYATVANLLTEAVCNKHAELPYNEPSTRTVANRPILARELNGIFNPDFDVLERLSIINNKRDTVHVLRKDLSGLFDEMRAYSLQALQLCLTLPKYKQLAMCMKQIYKEAAPLDEPSKMFSP